MLKKCVGYYDIMVTMTYLIPYNDKERLLQRYPHKFRWLVPIARGEREKGQMPTSIMIKHSLNTFQYEMDIDWANKQKKFLIEADSHGSKQLTV